MAPIPKPDIRCRSVYVLRVRFRDTDLMGIVHHAKYLEYFEAGRVEYLHRRGVMYADWAAKGIHLPVAESHVRYLAPARFDERLVLETLVAELSRLTVRFEYRLTREGSGEELVAEGWTVHVCVGENLRPARLPDDVVSLLSSPETHPRPIDQAGPHGPLRELRLGSLSPGTTRIEPADLPRHAMPR